MFRLFLALCLAFQFGCQKKINKETNGTPLVIVSIPPYEYIVEKIVGDVIEVKTLIPSGSNVHSYEPTPSAVKGLEKAAIYFKLGEPIETKITKTLQQRNENLIVYDLKTGIQLLDYCCGHQHETGKDIHIWLSPRLMTRQVVAIGKILINRFPEYAETFQNNLDILINDLEILNAEIAAKLSSIQNKVLLVSHPAFAYFCKDYDCKQISLEHEGKDPLPKQLDEITWEAAKSGVKAVIALPQFSMKAAKYISDKLEIPIYEFDPYAFNYFINMKYLTNLVVISNEASNRS